MATHDSLTGGIQFGRFSNQEDLYKAMRKYINKDLNDVIFFCIGTDRSTGDSYAPLVGTFLMDHGYTNVIGCIDDPVHAVNLDEKIKMIPEGKTVIAIDASLGRFKYVNTISFNKGKMSPGAGLGKELTKIGDYSIHGVVNVSGFMEFEVLQNTRLKVVMNLAKITTNAIQHTFPLVDTKSHYEMTKLMKIN